ncbi:hypothetical protein [Sphingobacterium suaedae]|uniref:O-antigen ligase domain-containing protein n=1 Tax=Sphingobacterium suaedae TaxID=1686402 RepID=A0ABW5KQS3_9SPHI
MAIVRFVQYMLMGGLVSFYFFPIGFTFLPSSLNTKVILAGLGIIALGFDCIQRRAVRVPRALLGAIGLVVLFSLVCFIAVDVNETNDYSYASYYSSFAVWLLAAYGVYACLRMQHGRVDIPLLTFYLAGVCFGQCVAALLIDNIPSVQIAVDSYVSQGQEFFEEVDRLYGIGAALDTAGVRFSIVLIMIAGVLSRDPQTRRTPWTIALLLVAFFTIALVGNMIARTTMAGVGFATLYFVAASGLFRIIVKYESIKLGIWFGGLLLLAIFIATYLYQTDEAFHDHLRFAFEGFFNWVEKGEWRTDSTDKLNREMWVWPTDAKTWLIGSGLFDNWVYSTDIGYCRFILYCGILGFSVFALFFVYNAVLFAKLYPRYWGIFALLLLLSFVIWLKVATDIFVIYALLYAMGTNRNLTPATTV